jgi:hypothetical protein
MTIIVFVTIPLIARENSITKREVLALISKSGHFKSCRDKSGRSKLIIDKHGGFRSPKYDTRRREKKKMLLIATFPIIK